MGLFSQPPFPVWGSLTRLEQIFGNEQMMDTDNQRYRKNILNHLWASACICGFILAGGNEE